MTKEEKQAYMRKWRQEHPEKCREYNRRRIEKDPEKWQTYQRAYARRRRAEHPEEVRAYQRKWYREHPEKVREYQRRRKERKHGGAAGAVAVEESRSRQEVYEDYDGFVKKFEPKRTTDDCITPPEIYAVIRDYVCQRWRVDPAAAVRPFRPGGDYRRFAYPEGCVVIDNPPFSILSEIVRFYLAREIPFFLFAPSLTMLSGAGAECNCIVCDAEIVYENGARVKTSFVTSFERETQALESCPELTRLVNDQTRALLAERNRQLPKYRYPDEVVTSAMAQKYARYGVAFRVRRNECVRISALDSQRAVGKTVFGYGLLLSEKAAAEKAAAEKAAAEKAGARVWELSARERAIVRRLGEEAERDEGVEGGTA